MITLRGWHCSHQFSSKHAALLQACCVRAARGAATGRAKNGAVREELRAAQSAAPL